MTEIPGSRGEKKGRARKICAMRQAAMRATFMFDLLSEAKSQDINWF